MRVGIVTLLVTASAALAAPGAGPAATKPKNLAARVLCDLREYDYRKDQIVKKVSATGCARAKPGETLVVLHVGLSNVEEVKVTRWWRAQKVLHVEFAVDCMPCHGANFGDALRPSLFAVAVTGVDKLEITRSLASCPPQDCSGVP